MQTHYGIMVIEYTINLIEEMIIIIWPGVCVFVIVSVPSKWLEGSSWFWQGGFPQPILLCYNENSGTHKKYGYFPLQLCPNFRTQNFAMISPSLK